MLLILLPIYFIFYVDVIIFQKIYIQKIKIFPFKNCIDKIHNCIIVDYGVSGLCRTLGTLGTA